MANLKIAKRIYSYTKAYNKTLVKIILLTIALTALVPARPYFVEYIIDYCIVNKEYDELLKYSLLATIVIAIQSFFQYGYTYYSNLLGQKVVKNIRADVFKKTTNLNVSFFDKTPIGQLITRTVSDIETIADVFSEGLISIVGDVLQVIVIISVMLYCDVELTLIVLSPVPLMLVASYIFKTSINTSYSKVRTQIAKLNTFLQEHISGMYITQLFAREDQEMHKFIHINKLHRNAHIASNWAYSIFFPVVELISATSIGLLVWYGTKGVINNELSIGVLVSFLLYINMFYRPIRELADKFNTLQMGLIGAERVFSLIDNNADVKNNGVVKDIDFKGDLKFNDVWFSYSEQDWILKGISFEINNGECLALVGPTGAGKSSIINIINRFYDIKKGDITINNISINDYDLNYLRSQIVTINQDVFLFSDTILNNITLKNSNISRQQVEDAINEIGAFDFINRLPNGLDYDVKERGAALSVGQAQLISIIRAFVYNPKILILDEATSSIDTETEILIQNAIAKLMKGRTSIVIAHRLSTILNADKIIYIEKGQVKESGSHKELLLEDGLYKQLYELQFNSNGVVPVG